MTLSPARSSALLSTLSLVGVLSTIAGCGDRRPSGTCARIRSGDLVISEVMANPSGADPGREWIEIWNASGEALPLDGLELVQSHEDDAGTTIQAHTLDSAGALNAGEYFVLGSVSNDALPDYVDYGFGSDFGDLPDAAGHVLLRCGSRVIDEVGYVAASDGASRIYDGSYTPSASGNDDLTRWCDSEGAFSAGDLGSPGAANEACEIVSTTTCVDGDDERDIVAPVVGDLVLTELMPDPNTVTDGEGEWIEVLVAADVDLNGLELGQEPGVVLERVTSNDCLRASAGTYLVFAANMNGATNGGIPRVDYVADLSLPNHGGSVFVGREGVVLDALSYPSASPGASTQLDPRHLDPAENDDELAWCPGVAALGDGDLGTPGDANHRCELPLPEGMCDDAGTARAIVPPVAGEPVITEIMPNPSGRDETREWFEVYFPEDADLNGLGLGTVADSIQHRIDGRACIHVTGGSHVLFARSDDVTMNGGLPAPDVLYDTVTLGNGATSAEPGTLILSLGGAVLDVARYYDAPDGVAQSLSLDQRDAAANEAETHWCRADPADTYGDGDRGTPGDENPTCPRVAPEGMCFDGELLRPRDVPAPGELVITEVMPDSDAVADSSGEWFELYATADLDLNGLELGTSPGSVSTTVEALDCLSVSAGTFVLFVRDAETETNGGLPEGGVPYAMGLANDPGALVIGVGGLVLDEVSWTRSPTGASLQLDRDEYDTSTNDAFSDVACEGRRPYGAGDRGTPGEENGDCPRAGECWDGERARALISPELGDVYINELMPNPSTSHSGSESAGAEWFELVTTRDVDLNGLVISSEGQSFTLASAVDDGACLMTPADRFLVFARSADPEANAGLPLVDYAYRSVSMSNASGWLGVSLGETTLDIVTWSGTTDGVARALATGTVDPTRANDDDDAYCAQLDVYGDALDDNRGTPGAPNTCP